MFSCFSRSLNKVSARSMPELEASIASSYEGVKVVWMRTVVSYWQTIAARWNTSISLSRSFSFELSLRGGRSVLRTKDAMAHEEWLPMGGLQFATPVLLPKVPAAEPINLLFVVPAVHPVNTLRAVIEADEQRLRLQRSTVKFALEPEGACYEWWLCFLDTESTRAEAMCPVCRTSRVELAGIIISQQKSKSEEIKQANRTKAARRETLLQELDTHVCPDRNQGKLTVPLNHSRTLTALAATTMPLAPLDQECSGAEGQEEAGEEQDLVPSQTAATTSMQTRNAMLTGV